MTTIRTFGATHRGRWPLPHQSIATERDLHGEEIAARLGGQVMGWCLTDEQVEARRAGGPHLPYRYLVSSPRSSALPWVAFWDFDGLVSWARAYDVAIEVCPSTDAGGTMILRLPESMLRWQSLGGGTDPSVGHYDERANALRAHRGE